MTKLAADTIPLRSYSDYIVYVDESSDHSLTSIDPDYPVFVLSFCLFRKDEHAKDVTPVIRQLKFATFNHDMVLLHEAGIQRRPDQASRAALALEGKFYRDSAGHKLGVGLKVFP